MTEEVSFTGTKLLIESHRMLQDACFFISVIKANHTKAMLLTGVPVWDGRVLNY